MEEQKVYCPYCGPWNGHPEGVEMIEGGNEPFGSRGITFPAVYWYYCPACGVESPHVMGCEKEAHSIALRRFTPPLVPLTLEELQSARKPFMVWTEFRDEDELHWDVIDHFIEDDMRLWGAKIRFGRTCGITWRCWRVYPTDEERAAAQWNGD